MKDELERLVDAMGIQAVLENLSEICYEKSDHVMVNWQDENLAQLWNSCGVSIESASEQVAIGECQDHCGPS